MQLSLLISTSKRSSIMLSVITRHRLGAQMIVRENKEFVDKNILQ